MSHQSTLSETILTCIPKGYVEDSKIQDIYVELDKLTIPTENNSDFQYKSWNSFIKNTSSIEAIKARENYASDSVQYKILSAIAAQKYKKYLTDAFTITHTGEPSTQFIDKIHTLLQESLTRYPLTVLLSSWINEIYICEDKEAIKSKSIVSQTTSGYYHPEEHWIAVARDSSWGPDSWPVSKKYQSETYERSVLLHEIGHALHYMIGLQTEGSETVDNRDTTIQNSSLTVKQHAIQNNWQYRFVYNCAKAYGVLLDETYETLRFKNYQQKTVEEMFAEAFNAYVTAPRYLAEIQPLTYTILNTYCER